MSQLSHIFKEFGPDYYKKYKKTMPANQGRALRAILSCRTRKQGIAYYKCEKCGTIHGIYRSCGNRNCYMCQRHKSREWMAERIKHLIPGDHYSVTFVPPQEVAKVLNLNQKEGYSILFRASSKALSQSMARSVHAKGAISGFMGVLHTWGSTLPEHPHIHYLVPGGTLANDGSQWHPFPKGSFLNEEALSVRFQQIFKTLIHKSDLKDKIPLDALDKPFRATIRYAGDGQAFIKYLTPTIFKVGVDEKNIVKIDKDQITISHKKKDSNRPRHTILSAEEFIRRYLKHVLPSGFMKVRYYGFMHPASKHKLKDIQHLAKSQFDSIKITPPPEIKLMPPLCPRCNTPMEYIETIAPHKMPPDDPG